MFFISAFAISDLLPSRRYSSNDGEFLSMQKRTRKDLNLSSRSLDFMRFRRIVESYLQRGYPTGKRCSIKPSNCPNSPVNESLRDNNKLLSPMDFFLELDEYRYHGFVHDVLCIMYNLYILQYTQDKPQLYFYEITSNITRGYTGWNLSE